MVFILFLQKRKNLENWRKVQKIDRKVIGSVICPVICPDQAEAENWRQQAKVIWAVICPRHSKKLGKSLAEAERTDSQKSDWVSDLPKTLKSPGKSL